MIRVLSSDQLLRAVSSLIAQGTEFPLKKPAGFHWDIFLLGLTTGVAGILGLPFPNGLIPQAPFHTESLCVSKVVRGGEDSGGDAEGGDNKGHWELRRTHVVEQRVSNLAQGLLTLGTMSGPLLVVLHLIPQGVLAGLFFIMGYQALEGNGITLKLLFLLRDRRLGLAADGGRPHPLRRVRPAAAWAFVAVELVGFGATFAITQTVAAVGFPCFILALIPARALLLPRWFTPQELGVLDEPTASPATMENVGGTYGGPELVVVDTEHEAGAAGGKVRPDERGGPKGGGSGGGGGGGGVLLGGEGAIGSEQELAEKGENKGVRLSTSASGPRRRNSTVVRDDDQDSVETRRSGVSRRHPAGKAQE